MNSKEKEMILNQVVDWAGSRSAAEKWYNQEKIPALGCTPKEAINSGNIQELRTYIEAIKIGGFA